MSNTTRTSTTKGVLEMTAAMTIAGTVGWFVLATALPATQVVFWRCLFGALAMALVCAARGILRRGMMTRKQVILALLGGVTLTLNWVCLFAAYADTSIAVATITYHVQPFILVIFGALLFNESLTRCKLGWMALAFCGVVLIAGGGHYSGADAGRYLTGIGFALAAAVFYAITAAIAKGLTGVPPSLIVLVQMLVGSLLLWPYATWPTGQTAGHTWGLLLVIGFVHTGLMSTLLYGAVQKIPTAAVGALSFIYPIVAILVDAWALSRPLGLLQLAGTLLILTAIVGINAGWGLLSPRPVRQ